MKTLAIISLMLLPLGAFAQSQESSADLTCRAKAKEVALQSYSLCMSDHKSKQTDALRRAYEEEALKLKAQYEAEIAKVQASADAAAAPKAPETAPATVTVAPAPVAAPAPTPALSVPLLDKKQKTEPAVTKGVSKVLPAKKVKTQYLPIQTIIEGPKVVNISTTLSPDLENE